MRSTVFLAILFIVTAVLHYGSSQWHFAPPAAGGRIAHWMLAALFAAGLTSCVGLYLRHARQRRQDRLADLAHEMRAALALMQGELAAAQDGLRDTDPDFLSRLQADVHLLDQLARGLARPDAPAAFGPPGARTPIALQDCIRQVAERFRHDMARQCLGWQLAYDTDCRLQADPVALAQLFGNLMSNTLRHAGPGCLLRVRVRRIGSKLLVHWEDSGAGVADNALTQLGRRGFRAHPDRPGSGRGLAIARDIVAAHGGELHFSRGEHGGLRIEIRLPAGWAV